MRILIDTNIIIPREDYKILPGNLSELLGLFNKLKCEIFVHPNSIEEIKKDKDNERKKINLSKVQTYTQLVQPPNYLKDEKFYSFVGKPKNEHDYIDNNILYSVCKNAVDYLITEDKGILSKSESLTVENKVFSIDEALTFFKSLISIENIDTLPSFKQIPCYNINPNDEIFDSLKKEYQEFENWWLNKCVCQNRNAWVYQENDVTKAILILKTENKVFSECNPPLKASKMLKICLFKVSPEVRGHRIGERFIRMAVDYCINNNLDSMYLTHFTQENDDLVPIINKFGFYKHGMNNRGEEIYVKKLLPSEITDKNISLNINKQFYPSFYQGESVRKFLVPIQPSYHQRLFPDFHVKTDRQITLFDSNLNSEGNSIKKAYLCHSKIKQISQGDIILFYQSQQIKGITALGVVESVHCGLRDAQEILQLVSKRTVYRHSEIETIAKKPTLVILFWYYFYFNNNVKLQDTLNRRILSAHPQSIIEISHDKYLQIIELGGLNERFTFN